MYLWCSHCLHATFKEAWIVKGFKYGVCPVCGSSEYRNAESWSVIAAANGYPNEPDSSRLYNDHPVLF